MLIDTCIVWQDATLTVLLIFILDVKWFLCVRNVPTKMSAICILNRKPIWKKEYVLKSINIKFFLKFQRDHWSVSVWISTTNYLTSIEGVLALKTTLNEQKIKMNLEQINIHLSPYKALNTCACISILRNKKCTL